MNVNCEVPTPGPIVLRDHDVIVSCNGCGATITVPSSTPLEWIEGWFFDHSMPVTQ